MSNGDVLNWQPVIVAGIGFVGSIIVAGIGFLAAVRAAKVSSASAVESAKFTADANMKQVLCLKAHDAIVSSIKILVHRRNICNNLLNLITCNLSEERIRLNVKLFFSLSQKLSETAPLDLETLSVLPYIKRRLPTRDSNEARDADIIVNFYILCERINNNLLHRGTNNLEPEEIVALLVGLESVKEPFSREVDILARTIDVLYEELDRIDKSVA